MQEKATTLNSKMIANGKLYGLIFNGLKERNMTTKDYDRLGAECFEQLREINPKGGMKEFIRMAVEFGYKRAVKNLTIQNVTTRFSFINFMSGFMAGGAFCLTILYLLL